MSMRYKTMNCSDVVKDYLSGMSVKDISAKLCVSKHCIYDILKRASIIANRDRTLIIPSKNKILALYNIGIGVAGIAKQLGYSRPYMTKFFKMYDIPMRNRKEQQIERMKHSTSEQIAQMTKKAHSAARGREHSFKEKCQRAQTRYIKQIFHNSKYETVFASFLEKNKIKFLREYPVGPYNLDFLIGNVAVEIFGGNFHSSGLHLSRFPQRTKHILDAGYFIIYVFAEGDSFKPVIANKIITVLNVFSSDKSGIRKYRVIWSASDHTVGGCINDNDFPLIFPAKNIRDPGKWCLAPKKAPQSTGLPKTVPGTFFDEIKNILRGYAGETSVSIRCTATGEAMTSPYQVRECQAIKFELENLLGPDNLIFK